MLRTIILFFMISLFYSCTSTTEDENPFDGIWQSIGSGRILTGSAAELFALATMSLPHIKRIGSTTTGAMSTALEKKLPNGWDFALSNEIFMDNNF